jgi:hypothetical protein
VWAQYDATQAFSLGRDRWEAKDYQEALPLFRQALAATGSPNARFYVARCLRDLGQLVEAYDEMSRTVRDARELAVDEERYAATRDAAAAELALLEGTIGKLVVALDASLEGASVTVNGAPLPAERVGGLVAVLPGTVVVSAIASDGTQVERTEAIGAGMTKTVALSARAALTPEAAPIAPAPEEGDHGGGFGAMRAVGIGVLVVGVGGFVTFAVGSVIADDKLATLEGSCGAGPCTDPSFDAVIDEGKTAEIIAGIGLGVGIAGLVAGAALIIFGGGDESDQVGVRGAADGVALTVRF